MQLIRVPSLAASDPHTRLRFVLYCVIICYHDYYFFIAMVNILSQEIVPRSLDNHIHNHNAWMALAACCIIITTLIIITIICHYREWLPIKSHDMNIKIACISKLEYLETNFLFYCVYFSLFRHQCSSGEHWQWRGYHWTSRIWNQIERSSQCS